MDSARRLAMEVLGNGLDASGRYKDALSVGEAELSMKRRTGTSVNSILVTQSNLASTYLKLGRFEEALQVQRDVYSGWLKLLGEEHERTLITANNYAHCLLCLRKCEEAKPLLRRTIPVARRVLGEGNENTLRLRWNYAQLLYRDDGATLDELHEAVSTLEDTDRIARRVLGGAHPHTEGIASQLRNARAALRARETPPTA